MNKTIALLTLIASLTSRAGEWFSNPQLNSHVKMAHTHFLNNDKVEMVKEIKEGLISTNGNTLIQNNLLDLLSASYAESKSNQLPADWKFPRGLEYLMVEVRKLYDPNQNVGGFRFIVSGNTILPENVEQFQIIKYPSTVMIDKLAGIGEWNFEKWDDGSNGFWGSSKASFSMVEKGLYLLNIKLVGGEMTNGWFVVTDENPTSSPHVVTPTYAQTFHTPQPLFKWLPFRSPEYKSYENTVIKMTIKKDLPPENPRECDGTFNSNDVTEFTLGDLSKFKKFSGSKSLSEGNYYFQLHYSERKKFGDLWLSRNSTTRIPFSVK